MKNVHVKLPNRMSINFGDLPVQMGPGIRRVTREVAEAHRLRVVTPLPTELPHRQALIADGRFDHAEALKTATAADLASVAGIGDSRAADVLNFGRPIRPAAPTHQSNEEDQ